MPGTLIGLGDALGFILMATLLFLPVAWFALYFIVEASNATARSSQSESAASLDAIPEGTRIQPALGPAPTRQRISERGRQQIPPDRRAA